MGPRTATLRAPERLAHPDAVEFVRFCYHRRRVGWPELYDEMCAVAGRGSFRGLSADDLAGIGVGFSLFDMPALAGLAARVVAEEAALRRPVTVTISAATDTPTSAPVVVPAPASAPGHGTSASGGDTVADERRSDVPVGLVFAAVGV